LKQIVSETLSRKNPSQKRAGGVDQGVDPELKPQYHKKKKKEKPSSLFAFNKVNCSLNKAQILTISTSYFF
jgi:hypothetical protein